MMLQNFNLLGVIVVWMKITKLIYFEIGINTEPFLFNWLNTV